MNLKKISVLFILLFNITCFAQNDLWQPITKKKLSQKNILSRETQPDDFLLFSLNYNLLKQKLQQTQVTGANYKSAPIRITFPNSEGELIDYTVRETSVMHPDLAAKFPEIKSYIGTTETGNTIRFSITTFGLHAQIFDNEGSQYINPHTDDLQVYIVYDKKNISQKRAFTCFAKNATLGNSTHTEKTSNKQQATSSSFFRTYRLAMASTVEYSDFHISRANVKDGTLLQKQSAVLSAMVATMTRVNGIFEKEFAITMQLIPNNTDIIFINSDNLNNNDSVINQIQDVIDKNIGFDNYDIGHVVTTGAGGVASLSSVCSASKAEGVTGSTAPVGDNFDVDFVAHEIGHQFGAFHTFNNSCKNNISYETAYEPGSGSTIMSYAGICPPNVQSHSDDYFHAISVQQINNFIQNASSCSVNQAINNIAPVVNAGNNYNIPKNTPFKLTGSATDTDINLTYCWEQFDNEKSVQAPDSFSLSGPNFRSINPTNQPTRFFPKYEDVLAGNLEPEWEVLPSVARDMNFVLSVRDNNIEGGQIGQDFMKVSTVNEGPFKVNYPNSPNLKWVQDIEYVVNWDVAGTDKNGINTSAVTIKLSIDGGQNFDYILAENTENDGAAGVKMPKIISNNCRILIEAVDNIFYTISEIPFTIGTEFGTLDEFILYSSNDKLNSYNFQYLPQTKEQIEVYIFNLYGKIIFKEAYPTSYFLQKEIDISFLNNGLYIFQLQEAGNKITRKFAVMR